MINKENKNKQVQDNKRESGYVDLVNINVQCHIIIKDKNTGEILVNKRG